MKHTAMAVLLACLSLPSLLVGQTRGDEAQLLLATYDAIDGTLPPGRRAIVTSDPGMRHLQFTEQDALRNRQFAERRNLRFGSVADLQICAAARDCRLVDDVAATLSFVIRSLDSDSALVEVVTRRYVESRRLREHLGMTWLSLGLFDVRLHKSDGEWNVVSVALRAES